MLLVLQKQWLPPKLGGNHNGRFQYIVVYVFSTVPVALRCIERGLLDIVQLDTIVVVSGEP